MTFRIVIKLLINTKLFSLRLFCNGNINTLFMFFRFFFELIYK